MYILGSGQYQGRIDICLQYQYNQCYLMEGQEPTIDNLITALPLSEKVPVVALNSLLDEREKLDVEQEAELQKIHKKYMDKIRPLLERASQLIQGKDPLPAEVEQFNQYLKSGEKAPPMKGKIIDRYWNAALQNSQVAQFITEKDEKALEYLQDIQIVEGEDDSTNLKFIFKANPYFNQTSVTRKLKTAEQKAVCLEGDQVTWKSGNWLTHESKKINNKATGESKVTKGKKIQSFFDIFLDWNANENSDELAKCSQIIYDLIAVIRDSLSYFLGLFEVLDESEEEDDDYEDDIDQEEEATKKGKKK